MKVGTGFFGLGTAGTWSGGVTVRDGQLGIGHDQALGTGALTLDAGVAQAMTNGNALANDIIVTGNEGGIDNAGYRLILNGRITGADAIRFTDAGNLVTPGSVGRTVLNGDNSTWSGTAEISGAAVVAGHSNALGTGTIELDDGGLIAGTDNLLLANSIALHATSDGNVIDNAGYHLTLSGIIGDETPGTPGNVVFGGPLGRTMLTNTSNYTGFTRVHSGMLVVNGSIASSVLTTVEAGGTLGGSGTVGHTLIDGGTLSPGNSIGALTVRGDLVLTAASTYMVEVSPASSDFTHVTGSATLGGATVQAHFAPGAYVEKRYTILTADGGVTGTFSGPVDTNLPANFKSALAHDGSNAYLDLTLTFSRDGLNANQRSVSDTLVDFFVRTGGIPLAFGALDARGLSQASGEVATGAPQAAFNAQSHFLNAMTDPLAAGQGAASAPASPALGYAEEGPRGKDVRDTLCRGAGDRLSAAVLSGGGQRRGGQLCAGLCRTQRHRHPQRAGPAVRSHDRAQRRAADATRPRGVGAQF